MTKRRECLPATAIGRSYSFRDDLAIEPADSCHAYVIRVRIISHFSHTLYRENYIISQRRARVSIESIYPVSVV